MGASGYITLSIAEAVEREVTYYCIYNNEGSPNVPSGPEGDINWSTELSQESGTIWSSKLTLYTDGTFYWSEPVIDALNSIKDFIDTSDGKVQVFMFETMGENTIAEKMADKIPENNDLVFFYEENVIYKCDKAEEVKTYNLITNEIIQNILNGAYNGEKMITVYSSSSEPSLPNVELGDIWIELSNVDAYYQCIEGDEENNKKWVAISLNYIGKQIDDYIFNNSENEAYMILKDETINNNLIGQAQRISITNEGIDIAATEKENTSSMHLDSKSISFRFEGEETEYSSFSTTYVKFGNFKLWQTQEGGMAFTYEKKERPSISVGLSES